MRVGTFVPDVFVWPEPISFQAYRRLQARIKRLNDEYRERCGRDVVRLSDLDSQVLIDGGGCAVKINIFFDDEGKIKDRLTEAIRGSFSETADEEIV